MNGMFHLVKSMLKKDVTLFGESLPTVVFPMKSSLTLCLQHCAVCRVKKSNMMQDSIASHKQKTEAYVFKGHDLAP